MGGGGRGEVAFDILLMLQLLKWQKVKKDAFCNKIWPQTEEYTQKFSSWMILSLRKSIENGSDLDY